MGSRERDLLRKMAVLADLDDKSFSHFEHIMKRVEFPKGSVIMHEGEVSDTMYLFVSGEVDVTKNLTLMIGKKGFGKAEKSMTKLKADKVPIFGEMALFGDEPRSATVTASTDCVLYAIARSDFEKLCRESPNVALPFTRRVTSILCGRVRKGNEDVLKLSTALSIALSK